MKKLITIGSLCDLVGRGKVRTTTKSEDKAILEQSKVNTVTSPSKIDTKN